MAKRKTFFRGPTQEVPSEQDEFILPAHEFSHVIGTVKIEVTSQVHFA